MDKGLTKWIIALLIIATALSAAYALEIQSGTSGSITLFLKNSTSGDPITGANCTINVWNPSNSKILTNGSMSKLGEGFYSFSTLTNWTTTGDYRIMARCQVGTNAYSSAMSFTIVGTTVTQWFGMLNATTNSTLNYLQNTVYPAVNQTQTSLNDVLTNTSNIWNKVVDIQNNVTTTYNAVSQVNTNVLAINFSVMNELENNRLRLIDMNDTLWKIYNNITLTLNPKLDQLQTDVNLIKNYTNTLNAGQLSILGNLTLVQLYTSGLGAGQAAMLGNITLMQSKLDSINTTTNQVKGYTSALQDNLDCNGTNDTPLCAWLVQMNNTINTINANTDTLESGQTIITNYVDTLETGQTNILTGVDQVKQYLNCTINITNSMCWMLSLIQSYTDTLKSGQSTIINYVDNVQANQTIILSDLSTLKGYTDTLESGVSNLDSDLTTWSSNATARFNTIDSSISGITTIVNDIKSGINCTIQVQVCTKLDALQTVATQTNTTSNEIKAYLEGTVTQYLSQINTTTTQINQTVTQIYNLALSINSTLALVYSDTQTILSKWGSYNAEQIYNKTTSIETNVNTLQSWLNSFNSTEQQRYTNLIAELGNTQQLLNSIRTEIGFNGTSYTAYSYLVQLDSKLVTINATILNKIEFEANRTISQMTSVIQQNTTAILTSVSNNSNSLQAILNKWGNNTADSIIANITQNRNQITTMQAWLDSFNTTEAARYTASQTMSNDILTWLGIFNITESQRHNLTQAKIDELYLQINNTKNLTNTIISQLGYSGINNTLYDDIASIITKNNQIITLAQEINLTTHRIETTVLQINSTLNSVQYDTQQLLSKWSTYNMSYINDKLNLMDSKLNTIGTNDSQIESAITMLQAILNSTRAELGFNGTSMTAYSYLVGLDSKLVTINATILNKIEFEENATRQQIINAIQANTTAIINDINTNQNKLDNLLDKWGNETAGTLLSNITDNRNKILTMQAWLNAFNDTETTRNNYTLTLSQQMLTWLGLFNNTEDYRYNQTQLLLQTIFNGVNDTEKLSNQLITQLGYAGKNTSLYGDVQNIISQNTNITILVNEINLTTHTTQEILNTTIRQKIDSSLSNTSALLTKWGNYSADTLWQKTGAVETKIDTMQQWLNSFNTTDQQRYSNIITNVNDSENLVSALRNELNFTGKGITAYQYLVNLDSKLTSVNSSLWVETATEGNLTRTQLISVISSNTTSIINEVNQNENKINTLITKWGLYSAQDIINNITSTRNSVIDLDSWLRTYLTGENGTGPIKDYLTNVLFPAINNTQSLSNQMIAQIGYSGSNTTMYADMQNLANQQAFVYALAREINLTTHTLDNKINVINSTLNLAFNDTRTIISKFGNYTMPQIWTKLNNIQDYVLAINVTNTFNCNGSGCNITIDNTQVLQAVNNVRSELGFQGQSGTAYDYFVTLEADLISMDTNLQTKIETEGLTTRQEIEQAIMSNTTAIITKVNDNQNSLNTLINEWGNYSAQDIINNISDVRTKVINLNSWMLMFNDTEAARHATSQSLINNVLGWLGLFNQTEAQRHNLTQTKIDNTLSVANDIKSLSNTIIANLGYNGTGNTARNDTIQLMNLIAVLTNMVGEITNTNYIDLANGINAVALPKQPTNTSIISVMSNITGKYTRVDYWDDTTSSWLIYNPAAPFGNILTTMTTNKVYWIYTNQTSRLYIK